MFKNQPLDISSVPIWSENRSLIHTTCQKSQIDMCQNSIIDRVNFTLNINDIIYPVATANILQQWEYRVAEKWKYPIFKSKNLFHYPGYQNPLGDYLIILSDRFWNKIPQGIHQWVDWWDTQDIFRQGPVDNYGCFRVKIDDLEDIFNNLALQSVIVVQ